VWLAVDGDCKSGYTSFRNISLSSIDLGLSAAISQYPPESPAFSMPERCYRVRAIASRPAQYMALIFRRMAVHPALDLHISCCTLGGAMDSFS